MRPHALHAQPPFHRCAATTATSSSSASDCATAATTCGDESSRHGSCSRQRSGRSLRNPFISASKSTFTCRLRANPSSQSPSMNTAVQPMRPSFSAPRSASPPGDLSYFFYVRPILASEGQADVIPELRGSIAHWFGASCYRALERPKIWSAQYHFTTCRVSISTSLHEYR